MDAPEKPQTITIPETPPVAAASPSMPRLAVRFAIGLAELAATQVASTLRQSQAAAGGTGQRVNGARRGHPRLDALRRVPTLSGAVRRADRWRGRAAQSVARLQIIAAEERREGRALALGAWHRLVRTAAGELANSPELKRVIREQSQGMAAGAISDMRQRSARADDAAEDFARRALHLPRERR
ncbi:MAG TPA: hypothetical protein VHO67_09545 [Polyangia bacterium]|nr:hypothetical protein [Polyangia bacterium]